MSETQLFFILWMDIRNQISNLSYTGLTQIEQKGTYWS